MVVGVYIMCTFLLAMMLADSIVLYLAVVLFIKPLEQMARHLKRQVSTSTRQTSFLYTLCCVYALYYSIESIHSHIISFVRACKQ
jgi:hypothetical protein